MHLEIRETETVEDYEKRRLHEVRALRGSAPGQAALDVIEARVYAAFHRLVSAKTAEEAWVRLRAYLEVEALLADFTIEVDKKLDRSEKKAREDLAADEQRAIQRKNLARRRAAAGQPI